MEHQGTSGSDAQYTPTAPTAPAPSPLDPAWTPAPQLSPSDALEMAQPTFAFSAPTTAPVRICRRHDSAPHAAIIPQPALPRRSLVIRNRCGCDQAWSHTIDWTDVRRSYTSRSPSGVRL